MTAEEAIEILHPDTTAQTLLRIEYCGGVNGEQAMKEAVDNACSVACEALEKQIPKELIYEREQSSPFGEDDYAYCPCCENPLPNGVNYCEVCGQRLLWEDE